MLRALLLLLCLICAVPGWAHDPGLSVATAQLVNEKLSIDLAMACADVERLVKLDANRDRLITDGEFLTAGRRLQDLGRGAFVVSCAGQTAPIVQSTERRDTQGGVHFEISYAPIRSGQMTIRSGLVESLPRGHRQFLSVRDHKGNLLREEMLEAHHNTLSLDYVSEAQAAGFRHSVRDFLVMGVMHIATGYDHLLFLFGLLLVGGGLRPALQIITSFTLAHSITLALATLNVIHIPSRIIEPLIAASIIYVGLENILRTEVRGRWRLTFAFGLIHGCGFASALRDLGVGTNGLGIVVPLVSFNLGVELGQMTIAAVVLPVIWKFRASPVLVRRLAPVGSVLVVLAGSFWLIQRTLF